jgi:hypothetical protein
MTIKQGEPWGRTVERPEDLVVVDGDAALARALDAIRNGRPGPPVFGCGGDMARTFGDPAVEGRPTLNEFPIDLLDVTLDGEAVTACAHVVIRAPWWRGSWWRGTVVIVMNAEYIGDWDVAPRGHPNDGRVEAFEVGSAFGLRARLGARRRLRTGTHVPHPGIATRSIRSSTWTFERPMAVAVDGGRPRLARQVDVVVAADAAVIHA